MARRFLDSPVLYLLLAGVLLAVGVYTQVDITIPKRPSGTVEDLASLRERDDTNLIWILIDTLRADRLGAYGYERPTSPIIDAIADGGTKIIMITHDMAQARRLADEVLFFNRGVLVERAATKQFFESPESSEAGAFARGELLW